MADERASYKYDLCVVFDDRNYYQVNETVLSALVELGISYCDTEWDIIPGQLILEGIFSLLKYSLAILIILPVPEKLLLSLRLAMYSLALTSKRCIYISFNDDHHYSRVIGISRTPSWLDEVMHRLSSPAPVVHEPPCAIIFKVPDATCFEDFLFNNGLIKNGFTDLNILGIKIFKEIVLDLHYFMENEASHIKYKTDEILEQLQFLRSYGTEVELRIDTEAENINVISECLEKVFSTVCVCVFDITGLTFRDWVLTYKQEGPLVLDRKSIAELYTSVRHAMVESSFSEDVNFPEYSNEKKRTKTFYGTVFHGKAESMADAGFFFDGLYDRARCYHCGGARIGWKKSDDPWVNHAEGFPQCPLVKANMSLEQIKEVRRSVLNKRLAGNTDYASVESRKSTLDGKLETSPCKHTNVETFRRNVAEAGFYYVGPEDRVRCFSCGIMVLGFLSSKLEDLFIQHAYASLSCKHVKRSLSSDTIRVAITAKATTRKYGSVVFSVRTFDNNKKWPYNMLCT
ncbi:uncharacterized protein [Argopecten irradians]|uniref:uncharacterized protein n=1 Tax=Argopecten irradians TaxID=31199 RepID=UPI0037159074